MEDCSVQIADIAASKRVPKERVKKDTEERDPCESETAISNSERKTDSRTDQRSNRMVMKNIGIYRFVPINGL